MPDAAPLNRLLHLADSALPVGGYAFSSGLEAAAKLGLIDRPDRLREYLEGFIDQAASMELPFLNGFCDEGDEPERRRALVEEFDAMIALPTMKHASTTQGRGLIRLLDPMYPDAGLGALRAWFRDERLPLHFLAVFGLGLARAGHRKTDLQPLYLFMLLRDQISAAIRLGLVGPHDGHLLQHRLQDRCEQARRTHRDTHWHHAARSCPALEIAQGAHESIYSKLFQN